MALESSSVYGSDILTMILATVIWADHAKLCLTSSQFRNTVYSRGFRHLRASIGALETCVVVAGGYNSHGVIQNVWALLTTSRTWLRCPRLPQELRGCEGCSASAIGGGVVCIIGGDQGVMTLDLQQRPPTWQSFKPQLPSPLAGCAGTAATSVRVFETVGSRMIVAGGHQREPWGETFWTDAAVCLDLSDIDKNWIDLPRMPIGVAESVTAVLGGKVLVAGGTCAGLKDKVAPSGTGATVIAVEQDRFVTNVLQVYDPVTNKWEVKAPMPGARASAAGCAFDGRFYVIGGEGPEAKDEVFEYCPEADTWAVINATPVQGAESFTSDAAAVALDDHGILVLGSGYCPTSVLARILEPKNRRWIEIGKPPSENSDLEHQWWNSMVAVSGVVLG